MQKSNPTEGAQTLGTSVAVFDAYERRSWRAAAQRQRIKGLEFVIGHREGPYIWNLEGTRNLIDCGTGGGVHSLGHRHPEVLAALRTALDGGRDTGLWSFPNQPYLELQDLLARLAPSAELSRSVITLSSTASVDLALMCAFRVTGRKRFLAYRHGYHGHAGFAALATGSLEEGVIDYYGLPTEFVRFTPSFGDLEAFADLITGDIAAVILEPMEYETFTPASAEFLNGVAQICRDRGALFILDETRSGLGRSGLLWAAQHASVRPDLFVTGKGLSGGLYPVSALLMRQDLYDHCLNSHKYPYISSLGGNEISCLVAARVLELSSTEGFLAHVQQVSTRLWSHFLDLARRHADLITPGTSFGCIQTLRVCQPDRAQALYRAFGEAGILCHSVSTIAPTVLKFFPTLTMPLNVVDELAARAASALDKIRHHTVL